MRKQIKKNIKRQFQNIGVFFEHFPRNRRLRKEPRVVQEYVLRKTSKPLKKLNNHKAYNKFLKQFVPRWDLSIDDAEFTSRGLGHGNLHMHRKITVGDKLLFEKVYFNFARDLHNVEWFYEYVPKEMIHGIKVPKIEKIYRGELLTIIYFEFLKLEPIEEKNKERILIDFSKTLYRGHETNRAYFLDVKISAEMKNVLDSDRYKRFKNAVEDKLQTQEIALEKIHKKVLDSKSILTHGHISRANSFKHSILVDWDTVCYYPIGFDPAKIYYFLLKKDETDGNFLEWLEKNYKGTISANDWKQFERNAFYYLLLFGQRKVFEEERHVEVERQLIDGLRRYFPESIMKESSSSTGDFNLGETKS